MLAKRIQDQVEKWGVQVNYVRIQDITLIPHLSPSVSPSWRQVPVDAGETRGGYPTPYQPQQAPVVAKPVENQPGPMVLQTPPVSPPEPVSPTSIQVLKDFYEAVRFGRVRDPQTIREYAARFEKLPNDASIDFDTFKAAQNLYHRAWVYEHQSSEKGHVAVPADSAVQSEINRQGQANDNIYTGG